jgi:hypothetical protein
VRPAPKARVQNGNSPKSGATHARRAANRRCGTEGDSVIAQALAASKATIVTEILSQ